MYYDDFDSDINNNGSDINNNGDVEQYLSNSQDESLGDERVLRKPYIDNANKAIAIAITGSLIVQILTLLVVIITNIVFVSLKPRRNYVQLMDGKVFEVGEVSLNYRASQTIRRFVFDTLSLMFNWNGFKPVFNLEELNNPELDPGVSVETGVVPTTSYYASFAFREGLRTNLLKEIAEIVPKELISRVSRSNRIPEKTNPNVKPVQTESPKVQTVIVIDFISNPREVQAGKWEVDVVSTILEIRSGRNAQEIGKFNKRLVIIAVEPLTQSVAEELQYYQPLVNIRSSGLQIVEVKELKL